MNAAKNHIWKYINQCRNHWEKIIAQITLKKKQMCENLFLCKKYIYIYIINLKSHWKL